MLSESLDRLALLHPKLIDLGLERTFELLEKAGNPHKNLPPIFHIAGTNGKGSVCAYLFSVAKQLGLKTHCYTSPHLCRFNERIRIANNLIDDEELLRVLDEVEKLNQSKPITFYEITTVAAFMAFARIPADLLILETGLGGRLDATNVIENPLASIITPISRDHEHFLGSELTQIAGEKAGIIKKNVPVISASQTKEVERTLSNKAREMDAPIFFEGADFIWEQTCTGEIKLECKNRVFTLPKPSLIGPHQIQNAAIAATSIIYSGNFTPLDDRLFSGMEFAKWPGRVQFIKQGKLLNYRDARPIWIDGAHNLHGATALATSLAQITDGKWTLIAGMLNTRKPGDVFMPLKSLISEIFTIAIPGQTASLSAQELSDICQDLGIKANAKSSLSEALSATSESEFVVICGSLYLAGHALLLNDTLPE